MCHSHTCNRENTYTRKRTRGNILIVVRSSFYVSAKRQEARGPMMNAWEFTAAGSIGLTRVTTVRACDVMVYPSLAFPFISQWIKRHWSTVKGPMKRQRKSFHDRREQASVSGKKKGGKRKSRVEKRWKNRKARYSAVAFSLAWRIDFLWRD